MLETLFLVLALAGAITASVTDLRRGVVPNRLSFGLLTVGVFGNALYASYVRDASLFLDLAVGVVLIFAIGYTFWYLGGWSAGDAKEFIFLASLLPRYPSILYGYFTPRLAVYPFPVTIMANTFILIFPALIIYSIGISYRALSPAEFLKPLLSFKSYTKEAILVVASIAAGILLGKPYLAAASLLALHAPWLKDVHRYSLALVTIAVFVIESDPLTRVINLTRYLAATMFFFAVIGVFWNSIGLLRKKALREKRRISDLNEGDVIAEEIYIRDGEVRRDDRSITEKFKALAINEEERNARQNRSMVAFPRAAGLSTEEISSLKNHVAEGRLEDWIIVKKSMPFAPIILLGLLSSLVMGDLLAVLR